MFLNTFDKLCLKHCLPITYEQRFSSKKTNRLNQAFQVLTLAELHIVQLAIVDARENGNRFNSDTPLRLDALRYAEAFGTTRQNALPTYERS